MLQTALTRVGQRCRVVLTGDPNTQVDRNQANWERASGLLDRFATDHEGKEGYRVLRFGDEHNVRSSQSQDASEWFGSHALQPQPERKRNPFAAAMDSIRAPKAASATDASARASSGVAMAATSAAGPSGTASSAAAVANGGPAEVTPPCQPSAQALGTPGLDASRADQHPSRVPPSSSTAKARGPPKDCGLVPSASQQHEGSDASKGRQRDGLQVETQQDAVPSSAAMEAPPKPVALSELSAIRAVQQLKQQSNSAGEALQREDVQLVQGLPAAVSTSLVASSKALVEGEATKKHPGSGGSGGHEGGGGGAPVRGIPTTSTRRTERKSWSRSRSRPRRSRSRDRRYGKGSQRSASRDRRDRSRSRDHRHAGGRQRSTSRDRRGRSCSRGRGRDCHDRWHGSGRQRSISRDRRDRSRSRDHRHDRAHRGTSRGRRGRSHEGRRGRSRSFRRGCDSRSHDRCRSTSPEGLSACPAMQQPRPPGSSADAAATSDVVDAAKEVEKKRAAQATAREAAAKGLAATKAAGKAATEVKAAKEASAATAAEEKAASAAKSEAKATEELPAGSAAPDLCVPLGASAVAKKLLRLVESKLAAAPGGVLRVSDLGSSLANGQSRDLYRAATTALKFTAFLVRYGTVLPGVQFRLRELDHGQAEVSLEHPKALAARPQLAETKASAYRPVPPPACMLVSTTGSQTAEVIDGGHAFRNLHPPHAVEDPSVEQLQGIDCVAVAAVPQPLVKGSKQEDDHASQKSSLEHSYSSGAQIFEGLRREYVEAQPGLQQLMDSEVLRISFVSLPCEMEVAKKIMADYAPHQLGCDGKLLTWYGPLPVLAASLDMALDYPPPAPPGFFSRDAISMTEPEVLSLSCTREAVFSRIVRALFCELQRRHGVRAEPAPSGHALAGHSGALLDPCVPALLPARPRTRTPSPRPSDEEVPDPAGTDAVAHTVGSQGAIATTPPRDVSPRAPAVVQYPPLGAPPLKIGDRIRVKWRNLKTHVGACPGPCICCEGFFAGTVACAPWLELKRNDQNDWKLEVRWDDSKFRVMPTFLSDMVFEDEAKATISSVAGGDTERTQLKPRASSTCPRESQARLLSSCRKQESKNPRRLKQNGAKQELCRLLGKDCILERGHKGLCVFPPPTGPRTRRPAAAPALQTIAPERPAPKSRHSSPPAPPVQQASRALISLSDEESDEVEEEVIG